jgi:hypothetical protein
MLLGRRAFHASSTEATRTSTVAPSASNSIGAPLGTMC